MENSMYLHRRLSKILCLLNYIPYFEIKNETVTEILKAKFH